MKNRADLTAIEGFNTLSTDTSGNPCVWDNHYRCESCLEPDAEVTDDVDWIDPWSCQCNSKCPTCNREIEPYHSDWIGPEDSTLQALWEALPEAGSGGAFSTR